MKERIEWIDNAKGIGIILVIAGHAICPNTLWVWLCAFHMPLFFYLAGITYNGQKYKKITQFAKRKFSTLMIPYFFIAAMLWIFKVLKNVVLHWNEPLTKYFIGIFTQIRTTEYGIGCWFLPCMFLAEVLLYAFIKLCKGSRPRILICILVSYIVGMIYVKLVDIKLPWGIDAALICIFFIGLGMLTKEYIEKVNLWYLLLFIPGAVVGFINYNVFDTRISMWNNQYGNVLCFTVSAFCSVVATIAVSKKIKSRILSYIGRNSLYIYGFQAIILEVIKMFLGRLNIDTKTVSNQYVIVVCSVIIVLLVLSPFTTIYNWIIEKLQSIKLMPIRKKSIKLN